MDKITLWITSDLHGSIMPHLYSDNLEKPMGLAKISTLINQHRDGNTLHIDNGDVLEGNALLDYCYEHKEENPMTKALKLAHVDYINLGNHDFNYGLDVLNEHRRHFNCITGNVLFDGKPINPPYTIHTFANGKKMALIGAVTHYLVKWEKPKNIVGVTFIDALTFIKDTVKLVREKEQVDYVVAVYHGGFEEDLATGVPTERYTTENQGSHMVREIEGLDILISGHQHRSIATTINGVVVTQTAFMAKDVAKIEITDEGIFPHVMVPDCEADLTIMKAFEEVEQGCQTWLDQPLGELPEDCLVDDGFSARLHKHPIISFLNQVQKEVTGSDLTSNALFNDAKGFRKKITMRDLVSTYVYPNTLYVMEINGTRLKRYLEKCAEYWSLDENGEIIVTPKYCAPKPQHYNYDMVDGIEYTIKVGNSVGERIVSLTVNGKEVQPDDVFTLSLNNYRASGGGDFEMIPECPVVQEFQDSMVTALKNYILAHPDLKIDHCENIQVIK